jgi:hypothetical protein
MADMRGPRRSPSDAEINRPTFISCLSPEARRANCINKTTAAQKSMAVQSSREQKRYIPDDILTGSIIAETMCRCGGAKS